MQEEFRVDVVQRNAGEGSPERGGGANKSGGEPSPAWRPPEGPPGPPPVALAGDADGDEEGWNQPRRSDDLAWEHDAPPPTSGHVPGLEDLPLPPNLSARRRNARALVRPQLPQGPLTPQQKLLLLDTWQRSGLPARDFGHPGPRSAHAYQGQHSFGGLRERILSGSCHLIPWIDDVRYTVARRQRLKAVGASARRSGESYDSYPQ
jgi:hypothetical protein